MIGCFGRIKGGDEAREGCHLLWSDIALFAVICSCLLASELALLSASRVSIWEIYKMTLFWCIAAWDTAHSISFCETSANLLILSLSLFILFCKLSCLGRVLCVLAIHPESPSSKSPLFSLTVSCFLIKIPRNNPNQQADKPHCACFRPSTLWLSSCLAA